MMFLFHCLFSGDPKIKLVPQTLNGNITVNAQKKEKKEKMDSENLLHF